MDNHNVAVDRYAKQRRTDKILRHERAPVKLSSAVVKQQKAKQQRWLHKNRHRQSEKQHPHMPREPTHDANLHKLIHYDHYMMSRTELVQSIGLWSALIILITYSLYQSWLLSLLITPFSYFMLAFDKKRLIHKRKLRMKLQLKDILISLVSSLAVGRSLENCFSVASDDMAMLYPHTNVELIAELAIINQRIRNGETIEQSLHKLAERANIEELTQFVDALQTCKRSGGDLLSVMRRTASMLSDQISIDNEIQVLLAQKKLEGRIMMAAPFALIQFLHTMSPDYMSALNSGIGYVLLTLVLLLLLVLFWIMDKLTTIRM